MPDPTAIQTKIIDTTQQHPNLSLRQIATLCDTDHAHVSRTLQRYGITKESVDGFKKSRADVLANLQDKLISSITEEDIKKASLLQRMSAAGIAYDKERIERTGSDGTSKPMILVQINAGAGAEVKAKAIDIEPDK